MNVLTFSCLWPNPVQPLHGLFVRERTKAVAKLSSIRVVAPVPWFAPTARSGPRHFRYIQVPGSERQGTLEVSHPRYFILPKILKWSDGLLMSASLDQGIRRLWRQFPFDIIDAHWAYPDAYAASRIAGEMGIPYVVTVRGSDLTVFSKERLRRIFIRRALIGAQRVVCVARPLQKLAIDLGVRPEKTVVIENGIDHEKFHPISREEARQRLGLPENPRIVLSVGHLCELKGFHLLIEAVRTLQQGSTPVKLVIVGGDAAWDPYKKALAKQISEFKLHDLVMLAGPRPPEELVYWYSAADLFCLASSREGCPNVVLESLACGTPVAGTVVGSIPDILCSSELGMLMDRSVEGIRAGISEGLGRSWNRQYIAEHARRTFSWERTAANVHQVFKEALASFRRETVPL